MNQNELPEAQTSAPLPSDGTALAAPCCSSDWMFREPMPWALVHSRWCRRGRQQQGAAVSTQARSAPPVHHMILAPEEEVTIECVYMCGLMGLNVRVKHPLAEWGTV